VERVLGVSSNDGFNLSKTRSRDEAALKVNQSGPSSRRPSPAPSERKVPVKLSLEHPHNEAAAAAQGTAFQSDQRKSSWTVEPAAQILAVPSPSSKKTNWDKGEKSPRQATTPKSELLERRKSRRKSMSDARNRRANEEESALQRRDSLEDSVMEYLTSPRLTQVVESKTNKRKIAYSEVGDPNGAVVFVCVGMGLTRYVTVFYDELATTLRLRLITLDRPGVGGSGPYPANDKSGPLSWPDDIMAICQHLGITKFSLLAHSAGAIYALATSLILPQMLIGKVHLLAPWIPASQLEVIPHQTTSATPASGLPRSQRFLRVLPTPLLRAANASFMSPTSVSGKSKKNAAKQSAIKGPRQSGDSPRAPLQPRERSVSQDNRRESMMLMDQFMPMANPLEAYSDNTKDGGDFDPALKRGSLVLSATAFPTDPSFSYAASALNAAEHTEKERQSHYTKQLTERTWELATRDSNPATDLLVCLERHRDIGFRYTDVKRQIVITHGIEDKRVPAANIRWLADQMNRQAQAIPGSSYAHAPPSRDGWADAAHARGGCEVRILQGEGHGLMASPSIMSDVLTEIAGYWVGHDKGYVPT
jgi:pimeloyl-ACP methyl ester carboxylesterase